MRYVTEDGREFVLGYYSLQEWAELREKALLHLGCSEAYARRERIATECAVRP